MMSRVRSVLPPFFGLLVFGAALAVLRAELRSATWHGLTADLTRLPLARLAMASGLTALSYAVLTSYDFLAFAYLGRDLPRRRAIPASLVAHAISNNVGLARLSGMSVRYRFYTRWGVSAEEFSRIVFWHTVTRWLGPLLLGGLSLALGPWPEAAAVPHALGWLALAACAGYAGAAAVRLGPVRVRQVELPLPSARLALAQLSISSLEWTLGGLVLYVLLPAGRVPFLAFLGVFLAAQAIGLASRVPGGAGVFEGALVLLLKPFAPAGVLVPALIAYRAIYYLAPLALAAAALVADALHHRRHQALWLGTAVGSLARQLTPPVLAILTFLAGAVLLVSGVTPAGAGRLRLVNRVLPLGLIELSHFAGSVIGAGLLLLSQGLARRLDAAYVLASVGLAAGIAASLLKGAAYEQALALALILLLLWRARPAFDRPAALFDTRFSPEWIVAVVITVGGSLWLGLFAFKHVEYSNELWWQFELHGEASRMFRATVGACVTVVLFAVARLIRVAPHEAPPPTDADLDRAAAVIATQERTVPNLVFLRDKAVLFDEPGTAFVMYDVHGRTWVAMGDPVGPPDRIGPLVRQFLERCADFGGIPVFYQVSSEHLHRYADMGLTFVKLGEEARVDLAHFSIEGGTGKKFRNAINRVEREGGTFRVVPAADVAGVMGELRAVSDDWLAQRSGAEKGFSLGFFDPAYVSRFPAAVIERAGRVEAFATVWPGANLGELSIDLMRYGPHAPKDAMDALFVHLMLWGRQQGYRRFAMGMAPLSGFERSPVAPLWTRLGAFLYEHGQPVYNFQGLRAFKDKFGPDWQPRYLAYPGGLRLARVLADVTALIAGGYRRLLLG
jgi:phosphatidylglycerol lysyltransferase